MKCNGYGKYEGKCSNQAGTRWTLLWCKRCGELRKETITKQEKMKRDRQVGLLNTSIGT